LASGSPPPCRAATLIPRSTLVKTGLRLAKFYGNAEALTHRQDRSALRREGPGPGVGVTAARARTQQLPSGVHFVGGAIAIQVADEGPGIPAAVQDRLFEPFTTTKSGGTGLGLAITHRAVGAHGGIVLVDSNERGTRFTVLLPRAATSEAAEPAERAS